MSILDNIKGNRGADEGDPGGKFNPFRLLDIGEIMVRYTDGIRIKDFVFLAVLTSERLILIDSARQNAGQITKEIPFSVIKQADLERDEKDRPALAISMEVGGQSRMMRLVFTGLIQEPETECREWFTAINGYPPERVEQPEIRLDEPIPARAPEPVPVSREEKPVPVEVVQPAPVIPAAAAAVIAAENPAPKQPESESPPARTAPAPAPSVPVKAKQSHQVPVQNRRVPPLSGPVSDGSVRVMLEKPDIRPIRIPAEAAGSGGYHGSVSWKFCILCGARTPSHSRFCQKCGGRQT